MKPARNVALVSVDTLRFDAPAYEPDRRYLRREGKDFSRRAVTPALDALAAGGATFGQCISPASYTTNGHASMLTGLWPQRHGLRATTGGRLLAPTILDFYRRAGGSVLCASDIPFFWLNQSLGFGISPSDFFDTSPFIGEAKAAALSERVARLPRPFLLFLHTNWVHSYHSAWTREKYPDVLRGERPLREFYNDVMTEISLADLMALYLDSVTDFDLCFLAPFVDGLRRARLLDDLTLVLTADHGERIRSDEKCHAFTVGEEVIRVPLIVRGPGVPAGRRVESQVRLIDLAPTVIELAGLPPEKLDGDSLAPLWTSPRGADRPAYAEVVKPSSRPGFGTRVRTFQRCVRLGPRKLLKNYVDRRAGFIALDADPDEAAPFPLSDPRAAELRSFLSGMIRLERRLVPASRRTSAPDAPLLKNLRDLGYLD